MERLTYTVRLVVLCVFLNLFGFSITGYSVNFDNALGKRDPYFKSYYEDFMGSLKKKERTSWLGNLKGYSCAQLYKFCRSLYEKNKLSKIISDTKPRIPLVIHQIWLGSALPEKYKKWQKTWQSLPGFEYKLWTDKEAEQLELANRNFYEASKNYGQKADILRAEILYQFGGIYVDIDFECLNPEIFEMLNKCYDFYIGLSPLDEHRLYINNALTAAIKEHPFFKGYLEKLPKNWANLKNKSDIVAITGPGFYTNLVISHLDKGTRDIIFPPTFFYPLGFKQMRILSRKGLNFEAIKAKVVRVESWAIHWWDGSWLKPDAQVKMAIN